MCVSNSFSLQIYPFHGKSIANLAKINQKTENLQKSFSKKCYFLLFYPHFNVSHLLFPHVDITTFRYLHPCKGIVQLSSLSERFFWRHRSRMVFAGLSVGMRAFISTFWSVSPVLKIPTAIDPSANGRLQTSIPPSFSTRSACLPRMSWSMAFTSLLCWAKIQIFF